jgi:hypothetical protein
MRIPCSNARSRAASTIAVRRHAASQTDPQRSQNSTASTRVLLDGFSITPLLRIDIREYIDAGRFVKRLAGVREPRRPFGPAGVMVLVSPRQGLGDGRMYEVRGGRLPAVF